MRPPGPRGVVGKAAEAVDLAWEASLPLQLRDSAGLPIREWATGFAFMPWHPGHGHLYCVLRVQCNARLRGE